jgi:transposase
LKSARNTLPEEPVNAVTCGIDWARDDHAVSVVDARGREIRRCTIEHSAAGLRELLAVLARAGAAEVAIERAGGPFAGALPGGGIIVVVISPNQVRNLRGRYGSAGNKDDRFDAFVLAGTLRTDRARLRPLIPDSPATVALRRCCRARKDLVSHRAGLANQLRAHLRNAVPGAVGLFKETGSPVSLAFLSRSGTQDRADWLTPARLGRWLSGISYTGGTDPAVLHARLAAAPRGATGDEGRAGACITRALLAVLTSLTSQIKILSGQIGEQLATHADQHVFTSLPAPAPSAPPGSSPRSATAAPASPPGVAGLPRRRRTLHPPVRQNPRRHVPLGLRQATPRRRHRLRRRLPERQPLGRRPLPARPRPRPRPPPRRPVQRTRRSPASGLPSDISRGAECRPAPSAATVK